MKRLAVIIILALSVFVPTVSAKMYNGNAFALMYHRLSGTNEADAFTITPETFENDVKYLAQMGYTFCTASEFDEAVNGSDGWGKRYVAITFDDGYTSDLEFAMPILEKYNAKATFFVIGELVGTTEYMTKEQLKKLSESKCVEIGNHTYSVHNMERERVEQLYFSPDATIARDDYLKNKSFLETLTGRTVQAASFPWGLYGKYFHSMLKKEGIITFCSVEQPVRNTDIPYGRYNRAADIPIEKIVSRAMVQNY